MNIAGAALQQYLHNKRCRSPGIILSVRETPAHNDRNTTTKDGFYDSPPPKTIDFLQRTFNGCSTQGRIHLKTNHSYIFLCAKTYRSTTSGRVVCVEGHTPYCRRHDRESAGFETGDFVEEKLRKGATAERLEARSQLCVVYTTVFSYYAAADHSMQVLGWMRHLDPRQVVLARDRLRAECALSAVPVPGIEMTVQKKTTKIVGRVGRSDFFPVPISLFSQGSYELDQP